MSVMRLVVVAVKFYFRAAALMEARDGSGPYPSFKFGTLAVRGVVLGDGQHRSCLALVCSGFRLVRWRACSCEHGLVGRGVTRKNST